MRTIRKVSDRTLAGKLAKYSFIGFNIAMLLWFGRLIQTAGATRVSTSSTDALINPADATDRIIIALFLWIFGILCLGAWVDRTRKVRIVDKRNGR